jgi:hypothetical protein
MGRIRPLVYAMVNGKNMAWFFRKIYVYLNHSFPVHAELYRPNRANSGAATAKGALFLVPENTPREIMFAQQRRCYLSH